MGEAELIGFWSHGMLYNSAMQDSWLYFSQRGDGAYCYLRPGTCRGAVFTWRFDNDRLTTRTARLFSGDLDGLRRGDGRAFDVREARVSFSERFALHLARPARVLCVSDAAHGTDASPGMTVDFAYLSPDCPGFMEGQIVRAHAYFDPRGGLPRP